MPPRPESRGPAAGQSSRKCKLASLPIRRVSASKDAIRDLASPFPPPSHQNGRSRIPLSLHFRPSEKDQVPARVGRAKKPKANDRPGWPEPGGLPSDAQTRERDQYLAIGGRMATLVWGKRPRPMGAWLAILPCSGMVAPAKGKAVRPQSGWRPKDLMEGRTSCPRTSPG